MVIEAIIGTALVGGLFAQVNKSMKIDEKTMKKNVNAFTKMAESERKLMNCQQNAIDKLMICAKRKNGILNGHIKLFKEQFELIRKIEFIRGQGIEEIDKFDEISTQINQCLSVPRIANRTEMPEKNILISFALFGIGGLMIKESKMNLKTSSINAAQANLVSAQVDSICIALDGLARHAEIISDLLQKLGMMYMRSIRNISYIIGKNGIDKDKYSQMDIDSINVSIVLTKVIYRIINTPLLDENGEIAKESIKVIEEGNRKLSSIQI